jgi:hypothetical protein
MGWKKQLPSFSNSMEHFSIAVLGALPFENSRTLLLRLSLHRLCEIAIYVLVLDHERADIVAFVAMIGPRDPAELIIDVGRSAVWTK